MTTYIKNAMKLFELALSTNVVGSQKELCAKIGLKQQNYAQIRTEQRKFTHDQLTALFRITGGFADSVYGYSQDVFRPKKSKKPLQQFNEAVLYPLSSKESCRSFVFLRGVDVR
jgi:hypothetical protein